MLLKLLSIACFVVPHWVVYQQSEHDDMHATNFPSYPVLMLGFWIFFYLLKIPDHHTVHQLFFFPISAISCAAAIIVTYSELNYLHFGLLSMLLLFPMLHLWWCLVTHDWKGRFGKYEGRANGQFAELVGSLMFYVTLNLLVLGKPPAVEEGAMQTVQDVAPVVLCFLLMVATSCFDWYFASRSLVTDEEYDWIMNQFVYFVVKALTTTIYLLLIAGKGEELNTTFVGKALLGAFGSYVLHFLSTMFRSVTLQTISDASCGSYQRLSVTAAIYTVLLSLGYTLGAG